MKIIQIKNKSIIPKCIPKLLWSQLSHQIIYNPYFPQEKYIETGLNLCLKKTKGMKWIMNMI